MAVSGHDGAGRRYETQVQLDLRDPENADAARRYIESGGLDGEANRDLIERLNKDGQLDVRIYDTRSSSAGIEAEARGFGLEVKQAEESSELRAAYSRLPGGQSLYRLPLPP